MFSAVGTETMTSRTNTSPSQVVDQSNGPYHVGWSGPYKNDGQVDGRVFTYIDGRVFPQIEDRVFPQIEDRVFPQIEDRVFSLIDDRVFPTKLSKNNSKY
jgi:hypothetical protein